MKKKAIVPALLTAITALALTACGSQTASGSGSGSTSGNKSPIIVGSKNNTENVLEGEMMADVVEAAGVPVTRKLNLGGTMVTFEAIKSGQIDMYPEYTGTGLLVMLKKPVEKDQAKVLQEVTDGFKQWNIAWLNPAPLNATYGFAMKKDTAAKYGITTISDLAKHSKDLVLSFPQEFDVRPDSLPGLQKYFANEGGFKFKKQFQIDYSMRYKPLMQGQSDVTVSVGSDGDIAGNDLLNLKDDIGFFPVYNVAPIVRQDTLKQYPQIQEPLNKLMAVLTDSAMQKLDWEVDGPDKKDPSQVAKDFLKQQGLIK